MAHSENKLKVKAVKENNSKKIKANQKRTPKIDNQSQKWNSSFYQRIGVKLLIALFIPVALLITYGIISYNKSQSAMINNYEVSASDTISAVGDYINYALGVVNHKSVEYHLSSELKAYFRADNKDSYNSSAPAKAIKEKLTIDKSTNAFIANISMLGANGNGLNIKNDVDFYTSFKNSELAKSIDASSEQNIWVGKHEMIDQAITNMGKAYDANEYALSVIRVNEYRNGYIIIDISNKQIKKTLSKYDMGDGSITAFITGDGREITSDTKADNVFVNTQYYKNASKGKAENYHSYVNYNNKEYLFLYSRLEDTDFAVCSLIPKSTIISQLKDIKNLNVFFIVFACILASISGALISIGITKAITQLRASVMLAAKGDLTTRFDTKRKDEFRVLSMGIGNMVDSMRKLIGEASMVGNKVINSAGDLSGTSRDLLVATKAISQTIDNTQQGIIQQASDTESCLTQMTGLSEQVNHVKQNANEIKQIAEITKTISGEGIIIINELTDKAKATSDITHNVIEKVQDFELQSKSISAFVNVINDIASQTNLLSLNASIEAARAGEYGRGFAVVASEIRKLADQSVEAVAQIQKIVNETSNQTKETVETVQKAEIIVQSQTEALNNTVAVFRNINEHVKNLVNNLESITNKIKMIEAAKDDTLLAIESISAVSEQTAASTEEISATVLSQIDSVERLSNEALELEKEAKRLEEAINVFIIN